MKELKIEAPKGFEVDKENSTFERIVFKEISSPVDVIFNYHSITKEEFNKAHEKCSDFVKAVAFEEMIVSFYNKGEVVDTNNSNQIKYYLWFYTGDKFRLYCCNDYYYGNSYVPARLCFLREKDALEAAKVYLEQYKNSRNK